MKKYTVNDLENTSGFNFLLNVDTDGKSTLAWAEQYKNDIMSLVDQNGAVLIRGLKLMGSKQFGDLLSTLFGENLKEYMYRTTPRTSVRGNVYTATEYPNSETISQHNESAYSRNIPRYIGFFCMVPSMEGGETPISDSRKVREEIPAADLKKFEEKGIMYVRNYTDLDLPWSEVFQTNSKDDVESYCLAQNIDWEWLPCGGLRTKQVNPAFITHPVSGEKLWLNQAHLFHISNLSDDFQRTLLSSVGEENLPKNSYYGDGSPIDKNLMDRIRAVYQDTRLLFRWEKSDIMLLDNMVFTHGREPYQGPRKVLVGMT
jgi:alpha-ketoglutarate-dependent taurine dioxygenase